jgi:hypothetical protein
MCAAVQGLPKVMRKAAYIGSAGTDHPKTDKGRIKGRDLEDIHFDGNSNRFEGQPAPCKLIGRNASDFLGRDQGRLLIVGAH